MPESNNTSPGLSIYNLIGGVDAKHLAALVGPSVVDVLRLLDPTLAEPEKLRVLATRLIDPEAALRDPKMLNALIALLPLNKARELAGRLAVPDDGKLYQRLQEIAHAGTEAATFRSFFGVVERPRASGDPRIPIKELQAGYPLFEHQRNAARRVSVALSEPPHKVVLHMPTGAGKTRTAMHVVAEHIAEREKALVCWLATSPELLDQAAEEFTRAWSYLGNRSVKLYRYSGEYNADLSDAHDGLVIAGLAKLYALVQREPMTLLRLADRASLTVMDEAHQSIAPTYRDVISDLYVKRPGNALLGLTATPGRTWADIPQDEELSKFFDNRKVTLQVEGYDNPVDYLIAEGYLAKPTFKTLEIEAGLSLSASERTALARAEDLPDFLLQRLGENTQRNLQLIRAIEDLLRRHRRIIVFAASVEHARLLSTLLSARGHNADVVTGETDTGLRDRIIRRFKSADSEPMVISNFGVLTTGFDAPATSAAIIARPTKSLVLYSQMVGRATRGKRAGGNSTAEILTVVDPELPGFGSVADAFFNWEDVWNEHD
jgi:superfamily II DNA or RNA helicase